MSNEGLEPLGRALRKAVPTTFAPGFANRVMARRAMALPNFGEVLLSKGWRVLPLGAALAAGLVIYAMAFSNTSERSLGERLLGLQPITYASAYVDVMQE